MNLFQFLAIKSVRVYQKYKIVSDTLLLSVFGVVSPCQHSPSCSEYTVQMIQIHGTMRGLVLGGRRILSCNSLKVKL